MTKLAWWLARNFPIVFTLSAGIGIIAFFFGSSILGAVLGKLKRAASTKPQPPASNKRPRPGKLRVSRAEVSRHKTAEDLWIILKHRESGQWRVYDLTDYVEEHPGGGSILNSAGGDSTAGFYGPQHPPKAFDLIDDFWIGVLADS